MAGHLIYAIDWDLFEDLTTNQDSKLPAKIAAKLVPAKDQKPQGLANRLPASKAEAAQAIADLFLNPEWFADRSDDEVQLRQDLFLGLLLDDKLESIGLAAEPTWRPFNECVSPELVRVLAGEMEFNLPTIKKTGEVYYKYLKKPPKQPNVFSLFGHRPYRHAQWTGSNEEQMEFEGTFERPNYGVHSKAEVQQMLSHFEAALPKYKDIPSVELTEYFADLHHCLQTAAHRNVGLFVDNGY